MLSSPASEEKMGALQPRWFSEINDQWPGIALSFEVEEVLFDEKSKYQVRFPSQNLFFFLLLLLRSISY